MIMKRGKQMQPPNDPENRILVAVANQQISIKKTVLIVEEAVYRIGRYLLTPVSLVLPQRLPFGTYSNANGALRDYVFPLNCCTIFWVWMYICIFHTWYTVELFRHIFLIWRK